MSSAAMSRRGVPFIATHCDKVCPTDQPIVLPDCGAICKLLEHATGRAPDVVLGKPDPRMLAPILSRHKLQPDELAGVGDRLYTDIAMANRVGALSVLVLSGETHAASRAEGDFKPQIVVEHVGKLGELLRQVRS